MSLMGFSVSVGIFESNVVMTSQWDFPVSFGTNTIKLNTKLYYQSVRSVWIELKGNAQITFRTIRHGSMIHLPVVDFPLKSNSQKFDSRRAVLEQKQWNLIPIRLICLIRTERKCTNHLQNNQTWMFSRTFPVIIWFLVCNIIIDILLKYTI